MSRTLRTRWSTNGIRTNQRDKSCSGTCWVCGKDLHLTFNRKQRHEKRRAIEWDRRQG